jgi:eukaryotic-like serine/threonine-protein kinase
MMRGSARPPSDPFGWVGVVLDGRYLIGDVVGAGGFGVVHAGRSLGTDEPVAIKFLKLDGAIPPAGRERFLAHFVGEGKLLSHLADVTPGVVRAIDVGAATAPSGEWTPYLVLEWLDGVTLEEELAARVAGGLGGRTLNEAIDLLEPAARAIEVAHEHGALHRDIKPGNLVVTEIAGRWTLKILDFGVAKVMRDVRARAGATTSPPHYAFSPFYGAPEQFEQRHGATGPWTDVFALALVLVEVVAGRRALSGEATGDLHRQVADAGRRPTLRTLGVRSGDEVEGVLQKALAVDPRHRYRRAGEFWDALFAANHAEPRAVVTVPPPTAKVVEPLDADTELPPDEADWDVPEVPTKVVAVVAEPAPAPVPEVSPVVRPTPLPEVKVEPTPAPDAKTVPSLPSPEVVPEKPPPPTLEPTSEVVEALPSEASAHPIIAPSEPGGRRPRPTPLLVVAVVLAGLGVALMVKALSPATDQQSEPSQALRPAATLSPMAENLPSAAIEPVAPVATITDATSVAEATPPSTIVASTTAMATPMPTAGPTATAPPRVRAPAPPRDALCTNCATHPYQCGKFSLPQGRGDCYCGCSANSHCALQPGRSTGPCVPNGDGLSGAP